MVVRCESLHHESICGLQYFLLRLSVFLFIMYYTLCPKEREERLRQNGAAMKKINDVSVLMAVCVSLCENVPIILH